MDKALQIMTRDMTSSEKAEYERHWDASVTEHTKATILAFDEEYIFTTNVGRAYDFWALDDTNVMCSGSCGQPFDIAEDGYMRGDKFYCEGCDDDHFFFCEACTNFFPRGEQAGFNLCLDCACKSGSLIHDDICFVEDHPKLRDMEAWIQKWSNPNYSFDKEFEDYINRPDMD